MNSTQKLSKQLGKIDNDNYEQVYLLNIELELNDVANKDLEYR